MREFVFRLDLSFDGFKPYYQGTAENVQVTDVNGVVLRIHGRHFRQYLTAEGIHGLFRLVIEDNGHFKSLQLL
ncbi:DUF2835 domain-containing protein [Shewanella avicenniae]|uniref:DUF2835 domain-containing protein n=1 Tax=Shewanella avicenniae TaxID=2814294 RepID=A0ABX7QMN4_9GAMM|nr:DUF2835 family protein [Shewanella avicenniae]QSX32160.1 DUF2835 domain-containing protein [Shewanella avicenniae]